MLLQSKCLRKSSFWKKIDFALHFFSWYLANSLDHSSLTLLALMAKSMTASPILLVIRDNVYLMSLTLVAKKFLLATWDRSVSISLSAYKLLKEKHILVAQIK